MWKGDDPFKEGDEKLIMNPDQKVSMYEELKVYFQLLAVVAVLVLVLIIVGVIFRKQRNKVWRFLQKQIKKLKWNGVIRSVYITYMKQCVTFGA